MRFDVITIFPEVLKAYFNSSILARAQKNKKIKINVINLRDFSSDRHRKVDDKPYGGGPGMVFKLEPLIKAVSSLKLKVKSEKLKVILFAPTGKQFNSKMAADFAKKYDRIVMIAGHYEGIDARLEKVIENWKSARTNVHSDGLKIENLSIGSYVLTGGEVPTMVLVDAVARHIPGVLGKEESLEEKRFGVGVPAYTRPEVFKYPLDSARGKKIKKYSVPKVLLSGDHKKIEEWRRKHQK